MTPKPRVTSAAVKAGIKRKRALRRVERGVDSEEEVVVVANGCATREVWI